VTTLRDAPDAPASWPFAPIEELDVYLENTDEPSLVQLETHTLGHLDRAALESALADALAADPSARRHLAATSRWSRRLRWEAGAPALDPASYGQAGLLTVTRWSSPGQLTALREQLSAWPLSLHRTAARVVLAAGPEHDVVLVQTHHAAFDGISSLALLGAICAAYRDAAGVGIRLRTAAPSRPGSGQLDPAPHRSSPGPATATRGSGHRAGLPRLPGVVTRIAAHAAQPDRPGNAFVLEALPVPRPARQGAGPYPTVNDLLVAALILTVDRWNAVHGRRSGTIRITVPVNGRDPQRRWDGPGNLSRLIRVTARPGQRADAADLLAQVAAQTRAGKLAPRPGLDAVSRLLASGWAPAAIKRPAARLARRLARPVCTDTSLVSNLGVLPEPPSFSGTGQEPLWFSGPSPMPPGLGVGAVTIAGRLHLCVHYRPALLDSGAAADFTADYCRTPSPALARLPRPAAATRPRHPRSPRGPGTASSWPPTPRSSSWPRPAWPQACWAGAHPAGP
jgi:hypothetical protein